MGSQLAVTSAQYVLHSTKQAEGKGTTNLNQRIRLNHVNFEAEMLAAGPGKMDSLLLWVSKKAQNWFG
ncbi:hypothetical protein L914_20016 [Phytophthora nicotianae]|uniref:Uncharacterized protein n=1 Tax=Phytophthora nicotianae TaxID=4792 RepID=W2M8B6_PHYNI|nr:hypothetical protein L914_20016 [Phytophthora nicotianae]